MTAISNKCDRKKANKSDNIVNFCLAGVTCKGGEADVRSRRFAALHPDRVERF